MYTISMDQYISNTKIQTLILLAEMVVVDGRISSS